MRPAERDAGIQIKLTTPLDSKFGASTGSALRLRNTRDTSILNKTGSMTSSRMASAMLSIEGNLRMKGRPSNACLVTGSLSDAPYGCDRFRMTQHLLSSLGQDNNGEQ